MANGPLTSHLSPPTSSRSIVCNGLLQQLLLRPFCTRRACQAFLYCKSCPKMDDNSEKLQMSKPTVHPIFTNSFSDQLLDLAYQSQIETGVVPLSKFNRKGILLEPQPSSDPHDPLNFPSWQKISILFVLAYWAFLGTANLIIVVSFWSSIFEHTRPRSLMLFLGPIVLRACSQL